MDDPGQALPGHRRQGRIKGLAISVGERAGPFVRGKGLPHGLLSLAHRRLGHLDLRDQRPHLRSALGPVGGHEAASDQDGEEDDGPQGRREPAGQAGTRRIHGAIVTPECPGRPTPARLRGYGCPVTSMHTQEDWRTRYQALQSTLAAQYRAIPPGTPIRLTLREKANPFKGRAKRKH